MQNARTPIMASLRGRGDDLFRPLRGYLPLKGKAGRTRSMACLQGWAVIADANYGVPTGGDDLFRPLRRHLPMKGKAAERAPHRRAYSRDISCCRNTRAIHV